MERASRTKVVAAVVLTLVFGTGLLVGYAADRSMMARSSEVPDEAESGDRREANAPRTRSFVYEQLHPTDAQQVRIDSIMIAQRAKMDWLRSDFEEARRVYRENYDAVVQDLREGIASVFPSEQAEEYRRLLAEYDRRRENERSSRSGRR